MPERFDGDLKGALDALDACQVPGAEAGWDDRLMATLEAEVAGAEAGTAAAAWPGADASQGGGSEPAEGGAGAGAQPRRLRRLTRLRLVAAACIALSVLFVLVCSGAGAMIGIPSPISSIRHRHDPAHKVAAHPPVSPLPTPSPSRTPRTPSASPTAVPSRVATPFAQVATNASPWTVGRVHAPALLPTDSGTTADLTAVTFANAADGWAVGGNGAITTTRDGGATWQMQASGNDAWLRDVAFADRSTGWVTGPARSVLNTSDGGRSWALQAVPAAGHLHAVAAADATHAWVAGSDGESRGQVAATTDGGATWLAQTVDAPALTGIAFADRAHGWAVGAQGAIIATTDGGTTWTAQTSGTTADLTAVDFTDAKNGWAAGQLGGDNAGRALLLATSDGGATWTQRYLGDRGTSLGSPSFADALRGWAVARYRGRYYCVTTSDGGASWRTALQTRSAVSGVAAAGQGACAVGADGAVYAGGSED